MIPEVHARLVFSFHRLAQELAGSRDIEACVRESSLYTGDQNSSAADLATHFSVLWAVLTVVRPWNL